MKILLAVGLIVFIQFNTNAQSLEGIWLSSSRVDVQQTPDSSYWENGEWRTISLSTPRLDTAYFSAYVLMHFLPQKEVVVKGIGMEENRGTYTRQADTIIMILDTTQLKLFYEKDRLCSIGSGSDWQTSYFVFERLVPRASLANNDSKIDFHQDPYWKIIADTNSLNLGLEIVFLDSTDVVISQITNNQFSYTSSGEYRTDSYENNFFLYIIDAYSLDDKMFRLFSDSGNSYQAQIYEFEHDKLPTKRELSLVSAELPSENELNTLKKMLIGMWKLNGQLLEGDTLLTDLDIQNEFYELRFTKDGKYTALYEGISSNKEDTQLFSEKTDGIWEVGYTGEYILLRENNEHEKYLTLTQLTEQLLWFNAEFELPDTDNTVVYSQIKMIKKE